MSCLKNIINKLMKSKKEEKKDTSSYVVIRLTNEGTDKCRSEVISSNELLYGKNKAKSGFRFFQKSKLR